MAQQLPIDFDAVRKALVAAVRAATGLDQNHVVMAEPEVANAPRPGLPYIDMKVTGVKRFGDDVKDQIGAPDAQGNIIVNHGGPRGMTVEFVSFASSHEGAADLMVLWQAYLDTDLIQTLLRAAGIAVWLIGEVRDVSELLEAGYEGRSGMSTSFGLASNLTLTVQTIQQVTVTGQVDTNASIITVSDTVTST